MSYFNITKTVSSKNMRKFVRKMNQNTRGYIVQAQHTGRGLWLLFIRTIDRDEAEYIRQHL